MLGRNIEALTPPREIHGDIGRPYELITVTNIKLAAATIKMKRSSMLGSTIEY
mgnify:CR=1 FL=1